MLAFRAYDDRAAGGLMRIASDGFTRVLVIEPGSIDALMMRAATYSARLYGYRHEAAIADLSEVIRLDENYAEAYFQRALVRAADQPSLPLAIADAEKALSLVPGDRVLVALVNKLKADRVAYEAEKSRVAEARAQRAADLERAKEQAAAIFLAGFAVGILNSDGKVPSQQELNQQLQKFTDDVAAAMALGEPCRTPAGKTC